MSHHQTKITASLAGLALLSATALANADSFERFVSAKGFQKVESETLEGDRYYTSARFPKQGSSAFHPDADLPAPVRAMLMVDSHDGALPHARYRITYQPTSEPATPDDTRHFVEITRFNLGPAVHAGLVGTVPAEQLADIKAFGVGPHVAWRFAMSPMRGMVAGLDAASRRVVSAKEAANFDCLGQPCARLPSSEGPSGQWKSQRLPTLPPGYARSTKQGIAPASAAEQLLALLGEDAQRAEPYAENMQRLVLVVSANAGGQEKGVTGLARNALVFDDAIGTQWARVQQLVGLPPDAQGLSQKRK